MTTLTSRSSETDHRAGFDWFHYAGWEIPTQDPRYKSTVRQADQTVHGRLAKSRLATLLETVKEIGYAEIERMRHAVGDSGKVVSLHTLMYRLGYNVNCIGIFGPRLDHVATRIILQNFTEVSSLALCYSCKCVCLFGASGLTCVLTVPTYALLFVQLAPPVVVKHSPQRRSAQDDQGQAGTVCTAIWVRRVYR